MTKGVVPFEVISLTHKSDFADIDRCLVELEQVERTDLQITPRVANAVGFRAGMIQLIVTWARRKNENSLLAHVTKPDHSQATLERLCATEHGLVGVLIAPHVKTTKGLSLDSRSLHEAERVYREIASEPRETPRGSLFLVTNRFGKLDHAYDHLSPATASAPRIEWFKQRVRGEIEHCISRSNAKHLAPDDSRDIAEIAYELLANAEEWGSNDIDGSDIRPNVRGIILSVHEDPLSDFSQYHDTPTTEFLYDWQSAEGRVPKFLEVSVFDAGVGLAQQAFGKPITDSIALKEEYDKLMQCLRKYSSASGRTYRGLGLHYVMSMLSKTKGFLRYRGGRLSLFRNFHKQPFGADLAASSNKTRFRADNIFFFDWRSRSLELIRTTSVDGALFTMLFPLKTTDQQLQFRVSRS